MVFYILNESNESMPEIKLNLGMCNFGLFQNTLFLECGCVYEEVHLWFILFKNSLYAFTEKKNIFTTTCSGLSVG